MKSFKRSQLIAVAIALIAGAGMSATAQSTNATFVSVDEFGNGTVNGGPISSAPAGSLGLLYNLPFVVVPGTVFIHDSVPGGPISDVILFTNTFLFFQSDSQNGADSPADVPSFTTTAGGVADILEQASYVPSPGMPGYSLVAPSPSYQFISEVPEPGCWLLTGLGWTILALHRRFQARK
jgi:hypothetical protein